MAQDTNNENRHNGEMPLARKVGRMGMLIHRYYEAQAQRHGAMGDPTRGQGRVLALLKAKPETTQRELSYLLDMRQQSLSELLAKLEEKGFVTREKSAEDGRVTVVRLTEQGAEAAPSPEQMSQRADALDCLSEEEQTAGGPHQQGHHLARAEARGDGHRPAPGPARPAWPAA